MRILLFLLAFVSNAVAAEQGLLIFSKTAGFRHDSIEVGVQALRELAEANNYNCTHSEDSTIFNDKNLKQYRAIIFLSTTGDILNQEQQLAFQRFIQAGGGFVGIHAASDTEYDWPWYMRLIGAQNIAYYRNIDTSIYWNLYVTTPGKYNVTLYQACPKDKAGSRYELQISGSNLKGVIQATNDWNDYTGIELGMINISQPGTQKFIFAPRQIMHGDLGNIKGIILKKK